MAFTNSTSDRMDELRFRSNQHSPRNDSSAMLGLVSPPRNGRLGMASNSMHDGRGSLTRRFTTDSGRMPTISSLTSPRLPESSDYATYHKVQLLEKKRLEYERLKEQKRRFEAEMQLLDLQQRREEQELALMQEDLGRVTGHQSEPTTPPELRDTGFPSVFSRPNRYSLSNLTSPGAITRPSRSGSQLTSPQSAFISRFVVDENAPFRSVPGTRRNSDEEEKEEAVRQDPTSHRATNAVNRYSMPVTRSRNGISEIFDQANTARFLFGDDEQQPASDKSFLQMQATEDKFPILIRREENPSMLSASSAALDLATSPSPGPEAPSNWSAFTRHRHGQQSLPMNTFQPFGGQSSTPATSSLQTPSTVAEVPINTRNSFRNSVDLKMFSNEAQESAHIVSPNKHVQVTPPRLQSSYSTNDIPTVKSNPTSVTATPNTHAQQHLQNHNANMGRIPVNGVSNRHSREVSNVESPVVTQSSGFPSIQSALHANAPSFGPPISQLQASASQAPTSTISGSSTPASLNSFVPPFYNNYNMQMMAMSLQNMQLNQPMYPSQNPYNNYSAPYQQNGPRDSQARVIQQRRQHDGEVMNRFANVSLEQMSGEIYTLCKDQHGCRFLQKKLEDRSPDQIHLIWLETNPHVVELMTDPFGNYLCQKLLEYCNDEERTVLIENASRDLVRIALNQHGTRALQKMIEFLSTPGQIQTIINALRYQVVELIQDLNGNHVIQKCLNKLSSADAQFIFDAVGRHCVDVGTHRHGCCVLQRCIDHASGDQKTWLIGQITQNAFVLVQDPFGNYVVQYILDLNEPVFTEPLVKIFEGRIGQLSRQKFSSNVIEKCLRCAHDNSKDLIINEMLQPSELERSLRDSFANYVIQTALDYASPATRQRLVDAIRPHLPAIRSTPYGRRIQAKLQGNDNRGGGSGNSSGQATPSENSTGQLPLARNSHQRGASNASNSANFVASNNTFTNGFTQGNGVSLPSSRPTSQHQNGNQNGNFSFNAYGRGNAQPGVGNYF